MSYNASTRTIVDTGANDGVSINDVQRALGNGSRDLGTLCTAPSINKWATFKPLPSGGPAALSKSTYAPYGLRTICTMVDPNNGGVLTGSSRTTLLSAIQTIKAALLYDNGNPFIEDLTMYVRPTGGADSAYRLTDFVSTHDSSGRQIQRQNGIHGYKADANLRYGFYDQAGNYHQISRAINIGQEGKIVTSSNQSIDQTKDEMWGSTYYSLSTRLGWGSAVENSLCVQDFLDAMFSASSKTLHHGIVLFTNDEYDASDWVAVQTIPWATSTKNLPASTSKWNVVEFLTTANVNTSTEFMDLRNWTYNSNPDQWMLIPGMIFKDLTFENLDPGMVYAEFIRAEVSPFQHVFNLQMRITDMGLNASLTVFLSDTPNPSSVRDFLLNSNTGYVANSVGDHYLYGASNSGITMYPSGSGMSNDFDKVFNVGQTYYLCIWGQRNQAGSSAGVAWSQALVATSSDELLRF